VWYITKVINEIEMALLTVYDSSGAFYFIISLFKIMMPTFIKLQNGGDYGYRVGVWKKCPQTFLIECYIFSRACIWAVL
jgi:hypothetical protein